MVELTEWERTKLLQHASATALAYMGHHANGRNGKSGLFPHEIEDMERWEALSVKLRSTTPSTTGAYPGGNHDT